MGNGWAVQKGVTEGKTENEVRLVFYGFHNSIKFLVDRYNLRGRSDVVIVDSVMEGRFAGFNIKKPHDIDKSKVELIIYWSPDIGLPTFDVTKSDVTKFAEGLGADIATLAQPGKIHRHLSQWTSLSQQQLFSLCHDAIRENVFHRENYGYCVMLAAEQARRADYKSVTIIETGVWNGVGLLNLCEFCEFINLTQGMNFRVFGFDTGEGLPKPVDWRDHPELWFGGSMVMPDPEELRRRLPDFCELIIGDVKTTIPAFAAERLDAESPLGFISLDVDLYSASIDVLGILETRNADALLPAVVMWVDDSYINILQTRFAGEALAISEFNHRNPLRKIDHKIVRTDSPSRLWHHCIYFAHIFDHSVRQGKRPFNAHGYFHNFY